MDVKDLQLTSEDIVFRHQESQLRGLEGEGVIRLEDGTLGTGTICEQARGDVDGNTDGLLAVEVFDQFSGKAFDGSVQA